MSPPGTTTLVIIGVTGSGKSTVAQQLVAQLGWPFAEGDEFHPPANVAKMHAGHPLDDGDRWPWLRTIAAWIGDREAAGANAVVSCSALKRAYREVLCHGHPSVRFVEVDVSTDLLRERVAARVGHYMPAALLESQLAAWERLQPDEPGFAVSGDGSIEAVVSGVLSELRKRGVLPAADG